MKKLVLILLLIPTVALAGEFGDASQVLEGRVDWLYQQMESLEERIETLETGSPVDPPVDPPIDPPPEPIECIVTPVEPGQDPLFPHMVPGRIEAEDFDLGGQGVAYNDTEEENLGGMYRESEWVDIKATRDEDGQFQLGWIKEGEWTEYTVCAEVGMYTVTFRVTANVFHPGQITLVVDGETIGMIQTPNTGSWDENHVNMKLTQVPIRQGNQIIRLEYTGGYQDINWFEFEKTFHRINHAPTGILLCAINEDGSADLSDCTEGTPVNEG